MSPLRVDDPKLFDYPAGELGRWASLGAVTERSVRLWYRDPAADAVEARLEVEGGAMVAATVEPDRDSDGTAGVDLVLPEAAPSARATVSVAGMVRECRLAPVPGTPTSLSFGFGSCHQPFLSPIGETIVANPNVDIYPQMTGMLRDRGAAFLALVGDQVYSDGLQELSVRDLAKEGRITDESRLLDLYRHLYRGYFNEPGFRSLIESLPTVMTWDDHDILEGWGSRKDVGEVERALFRAAERSYREYQHLRDPGTRLDDGPAYDSRFWYGDLGVFILDLRGVRDYASGMVIGQEQFERLDQFLAEAGDIGASTVAIVASVPIVHASPTLVRILEWLPDDPGSDVRDRWSAAPFDGERRGLLERLFEWQASQPRRQVLVLSGDVHVGAAFTVTARQGRGRLLQLTSSALCTPGGLGHAIANRIVTTFVEQGERDCRARLRALETHNNFGFVRLDRLEEGGHAVRFELHAMDRRRRLRSRTALQSRPRG